MPSPSLTRRPLFAVVVRSYGGPSKGDTVALACLSKEAAEAAAEALPDVAGELCVARVKRMNWRLVGPGAFSS